MAGTGIPDTYSAIYRRPVQLRCACGGLGRFCHKSHGKKDESSFLELERHALACQYRAIQRPYVLVGLTIQRRRKTSRYVLKLNK